MNEKTFSLVAAVFFLLVALGHVLRIAFGASLVIQNTSIPMWVSWIAFVVAGYLAYEGIRLARSSFGVWRRIWGSGEEAEGGVGRGHVPPTGGAVSAA